MSSSSSSAPSATPRRPLRIVILSMGGERRRILQDLFRLLPEDQVAPPIFCPGIPSRELRTRATLLQHLRATGILAADEEEEPSNHTNDGEAESFAVEFWRKAKTINRGRAVLACALAHLQALKVLTEENCDVLIEDNVRFPLSHVVQRIWDCIDATTTAASDDNDAPPSHYHHPQQSTPCHMRYYGWLGSQPNVHWIYTTFIPRMTPPNGDPVLTVPCPIPSDIVDPATAKSKIKDLSQPGGSNPVWGAYAYWISPQAYQVVLQTLQRDVGALLWKSKRMRYYQVKPIDKVIPRILRAQFQDPACLQIPVRPAFFRAPMLTSQIHTQWDVGFCKSTTDQLRHCQLQWSDLALTETEQHVVAHAESSQWTEWCTPAQLSLGSVSKEEKEEDGANDDPDYDNDLVR